MSTMPLARIYGPNDIRIDVAERPACGPDDVLIKIERCGICGSDLSYAKLGGIPGAASPFALGHEFAGVVAEAGDLVVRVRDRGEGLAPGSEAQIFEPFITTRVRGVGLGLPVARRIAEQHGGSLTGHNHPDGGAEFVMRLAGTMETA